MYFYYVDNQRKEKNIEIFLVKTLVDLEKCRTFAVG